jgi:hypothetical protein
MGGGGFLLVAASFIWLGFLIAGVGVLLFGPLGISLALIISGLF